MTDPNVANLLGKNINSAYVSKYFQSINSKPLIKIYNDVYYYAFSEAGMDFMFLNENDKLCTVFLHSEGYEGYSLYKGQLPKNLDFGFKRSYVHELLGIPTVSGGDEYAPELNKSIPCWDKYDFGEYILNVTYTRENTIALVCVAHDC